MLPSHGRFLRIATRLGKLQAGSVEADGVIHEVLGRRGTVLPYTTSEEAARGLLPAGFEWMAPVHSAGTVYMSCRRVGAEDRYPYPHHGAWGRTTPLAACGAAMRAYAKLHSE